MCLSPLPPQWGRWPAGCSFPCGAELVQSTDAALHRWAGLEPRWQWCSSARTLRRPAEHGVLLLTPAFTFTHISIMPNQDPERHREENSGTHSSSLPRLTPCTVTGRSSLLLEEGAAWREVGVSSTEVREKRVPDRALSEVQAGAEHAGSTPHRKEPAWLQWGHQERCDPEVRRESVVWNFHSPSFSRQGTLNSRK